MKNIKELYIFAKSQLAADGIEFPESEALRLCEHYFKISGRIGLTVHGGDTPSEDAVQSFQNAVSERKNRPLQYILGVWEFDSMELSVGEGVLIPREDTVALVETAERLAENIKNPRILDLCAGTGAVSLALARRIKDADIVILNKTVLGENELKHAKKLKLIFACFFVDSINLLEHFLKAGST